MTLRLFSLLFSIVIISLLFACTGTGNQESPSVPSQVSGEDILKYNLAVVQQEDQEIRDFADRYHWNLKTTETGLRYMFYRSSNGETPGAGAEVSFTYTLRLLNGEVLYQTDSLNPVRISLGKREVVSGLEEGLLLMNKGSSARLILPSHLGYGLLGDQNKVPSNAILCYDVTLLDIHKKGK